MRICVRSVRVRDPLVVGRGKNRVEQEAMWNSGTPDKRDESVTCTTTLASRGSKVTIGKHYRNQRALDLIILFLYITFSQR